MEMKMKTSVGNVKREPGWKYDPSCGALGMEVDMIPLHIESYTTRYGTTYYYYHSSNLNNWICWEHIYWDGSKHRYGDWFVINHILKG